MEGLLLKYYGRIQRSSRSSRRHWCSRNLDHKTKINNLPTSRRNIKKIDTIVIFSRGSVRRANLVKFESMQLKFAFNMGTYIKAVKDGYKYEDAY